MLLAVVRGGWCVGMSMLWVESRVYRPAERNRVGFREGWHGWHQLWRSCLRTVAVTCSGWKHILAAACCVAAVGAQGNFLPWHCGKRRNSCQMCAAAADRSVPKAPPGAKTAAAAPAAAAAAAPRALYLLLLLLLLLVVKQLRKNHHPAGKHHASEGRASSKTAPKNSLTCRLKS